MIGIDAVLQLTMVNLMKYTKYFNTNSSVMFYFVFVYNMLM